MNRLSLCLCLGLVGLVPFTAAAESAEAPSRNAAAAAASADGAQASLEESAREFPETARLGTGTLPVVRRPAVDWRRDPAADEAALEQVEKLRRRVWREGAHPEGPPLLAEDVLVPEAARVPGPPTAMSGPQSGEGLGPVYRAAGDFVNFKNTVPSNAVTSGFRSIVNEPSVVVTGSNVLFMGNWFAASSTDGGDTWSSVNPFSGPYTPANAGFCCDQMGAHDPGTDTVFYLQQFIANASGGTQRINVDNGGDGTYECAFDITAQIIGFASGNWPDFPDLAVSNGFLYLSSNVFSSAGFFSGAFVVRFPLDEISTCDPTLSYSYLTHGSIGSFRFAQGATHTMYFASPLTTSSMRIWSWPDDSNSFSSVDRSVTAWSNATRVCKGPDNADWCGFIDHRLLAGWADHGVVGFAWVPAQDGNHPYPYTRFARFRTSDLTLVDEPEVWSQNLAWVYPSVSVNKKGEMGGTMLVGGESVYQSCVSFLADSLNGYALQPLENKEVIVGTSGPGTNRSGDYLTTRRSYPDNMLFAGACFANVSSSFSESRFVKFGREENETRQMVFGDGFENADVDEWTSAAP